ncbi:MarR family transcriptional regulator [Corallococcus sp. H22C18031201]|uniref:MarR family winged helix-turn-helix transcriptional regulator n=1 Tax=Citreicoccus inhibens TaxID=2849499 RepID=UPI000E746F2A|nr:MarR family transcriptional regulator [Citreicoccus inhibens]MBU8896426.1 MarR family transcriptional regulator [Citreicoccus inhibens]RJS24195.1 MarR family transcriptional regulator [Corallococcus sp. H22C18031201]
MSLPTVPRYERLHRLAKRFPQLDPSAIETCLTMLRLAHDMSDAYDSHFTRHGLSQGRFVVLIQLFLAEESDETRGLSPAELADLSGCSRATMTGLLDTLEKDALVSRQDHPDDRRMYTVHLTSKGRDVIQGMLPDHYSRIAALMAPLSLDERTTLQHLLAKVSSGIPALRDP